MEREEVARDTDTGIVTYVGWDDCEWHDSPRDWEGNVGRLCLFHRNYDFPNELGAEPEAPDRETLDDWGVLGIWTVYAYEHGAITISLGDGGNPFTCRFDSGALGFIAITKDSWAGQFPDTPYTEEKGRKQVEHEVTDYDAHINGYYAYYTVEKDGEPVESIGGFLCPDMDDKEVTAEALAAHEGEVAHERERRDKSESLGLMGSWGDLAKTVAAYAADEERAGVPA